MRLSRGIQFIRTESGCQELGEGEMGNYYLMTSLFMKIKRILEMGGGNGHTTI